MQKIVVFTSLLLLTALLTLPASLSGQQISSAPVAPLLNSAAVTPPTDQIIIKFADAAAENWLLNNGLEGALPQLSAAAGAPLQYAHPMSMESHVLKLPERMPLKEVEWIALQLAQVEGVAHAEADRILGLLSDPAQTPSTPDLTPNDPLWSQMWHLHYVANTSEGINAAAAWNIYTGAASTVVAVIDTGILAHNDLAGRTVPGYDFISDPWIANDGNGRDPDPSDPGDWITEAEHTQPGGFFEGCGVSDSSWHGAHVAGTIGAATNNSLGIAGVNWQAKILPVRVLGKCGGYTSDIVDGMVWSAGLPVTGVPANANPAKVLNLSLGGPGTCSATQQNAVNAIVGAGSIVVVAAGNSNVNVSGFNPANCTNVVAVAATNRTGNKASYSNYGNLVKISGPGGEGGANGVLSTLDSGTTGPNNSHTYTFYRGTSMAAPHVAGVASLIVGMRPGYTPAQVLSLLQSTARPFPAGSSCNTSNCGAGIVDAYRALQALSVDPGDLSEWVYLPTVSKPEPPPPPPSPIVNPGFESGATGWAQYSSHGWPIIINSGYPPGLTPHGGSWLAWLGGDYDDLSYVQQQVVVPPGAPYLTYWRWIASEDVCGYDFAGLLVNGAPVDVYTLCLSANTGGWSPRSVNLSAYAGQTITFQLRVETDDTLNSNLFVDDFSFTAASLSSDPLWGEPAPDTAAPRTAAPAR